MNRKLKRSSLGLALFLLGASVAAPGTAAAAYDPLASATTTLTLDKRFASTLKANGIVVSAVAPARHRGSKLILPLESGKWDPTIGKGEVLSAGAVVFAAGRKKLPFRNLTVKANSIPLTAKVGGGQLKVASSKKTSSRRQGFGSGFTAKKLLLSAKAATRLNKKLRPADPFEANQTIGALSLKVQPATIAVLPRNRMTLAPTPQFVDKLNSLFVSLNPIAPAELAPGPVLSFPIAAKSEVAPDGAGGTIRTGGEVELLQLGAGQIFWREQWLQPGSGITLGEVNLQPSPPFAGKLDQAPLFSLSGGQLSSNPAARTVAVAGAIASLQAATAEQMNQLFAGGRPVFAAGEVVGAASFTAQGQ